MQMTPDSILSSAATSVLQAVLKNTNNLFAAIDTNFCFLAFNQPFAEEFKRVYGIELLIGSNLKEILAHMPEERQEILRVWGRGLTGDEFTVIQQFGGQTRRYYEIRFYPIRDPQNKIIGTFQLVQDVTDKKLVLEQLGKSDSNFHGLFDNAPIELRIFAEAMPQMAFIADSQGNITYYNQRHYDYFGVSKEKSEDWKWSEANMIHPEDLPGTIEKWTQSIESGEPYEVEYRLRKHDGTYRWHLGRALPVRNIKGAISRWVGTNTDIDQQKRAEMQLDQLLKEVEYERSRFEAVMKQMPAAVIIGEAPSGKLVFSNDKMAEVWGHELIPSKNISEYIKWEGFHPDGKRYEPHEWPLARSISKGEVVINEDVEIIRQGGKRAILRLSSTPLYNQGEIAGGVVICQDVTELKDAIRSRDEFLSIASHELKTPLTSLKLICQGVQRNIYKGDPEALCPARMTKLIFQTENQVNRLSRLVDDMLDISRISSGRISLEMQTFDLCQLLRDVVDRMTPMFEELDTKLSLELCESGVFCNGDAYRIEQAFTNLLNNAAKYGKGRPVILKITKKSDEAIIQIQDQGRGIAPEDQERIFNRYERLVKASEVSGLGLGLYITKQILELHHGKIWLESHPGVGSTFYVSLPLKLEK